jgi:hypothetical protein
VLSNLAGRDYQNVLSTVRTEFEMSGVTMKKLIEIYNQEKPGVGLQLKLRPAPRPDRSSIQDPPELTEARATVKSSRIEALLDDITGNGNL